MRAPGGRLTLHESTQWQVKAIFDHTLCQVDPIFDYTLWQVDRETEEFENALSRLLLEATNIQPTDIRVEVCKILIYFKTISRFICIICIISRCFLGGKHDP